MVHTVCQFKNGQLVSCFQTENTRDAYKWVWSAIRFMLHHTGHILGFFEPDGDRLVWHVGPSGDWQDCANHPLIIDWSLFYGVRTMNLDLLKGK